LGSHDLTRLDLEQVFKDGAPVRGCPTGVFNEKGELIQRKPGAIIGRGFFESDLTQMGLTKRELRKLVEERMLEKVTVRHNGAWRNTYVLKMEVKLDA
jgi:hypothetical protein